MPYGNEGKLVNLTRHQAWYTVKSAGLPDVVSHDVNLIPSQHISPRESAGLAMIQNVSMRIRNSTQCRYRAPLKYTHRTLLANAPVSPPGRRRVPPAKPHSSRPTQVNLTANRAT